MQPSLAPLRGQDSHPTHLTLPYTELTAGESSPSTEGRAPLALHPNREPAPSPCLSGAMSTAYHPHQLLPPSLPAHSISHGRPPAHPTALVFDPFSDLLWSGSSNGLVSSYASPQTFTRNVTFPAHGSRPPPGGGTQAGTSMDYGAAAGGGPGSREAVKALVVGEREVVSLTARGIGGRKRGGAAKWAVRCVLFPRLHPYSIPTEVMEQFDVALTLTSASRLSGTRPAAREPKRSTRCACLPPTAQRSLLAVPSRA